MAHLVDSAGARRRELEQATYLAAAALTILAAVSLRHGQDLTVFWTAARRALTGVPLYPPADGFLAYRYAPGTALLFAPLAALPLQAARVTWLIALVIIGTLVCRSLARQTARPLASTGLALAMLSRPLLEEFACGQSNLVVLGLLLLAFSAEDRGRPLCAGALLGTAVMLKLAPAVFLAESLIRLRWRVVAGGAAAVGVLLLAPVPFYGVGGTILLHSEWAASLLGAAPVLATPGGNQSLFALAAYLHAPGWAAALAGAAILSGCLAWRACAPRRALLLFGMSLASPMGWIQNFVTALPAAVALADLGSRRLRMLAAVAGASLLIPIYDIGGPHLERWVFGACVPGVIMLLLLGASALVLASPSLPRSSASADS